MDNRRDLPPSIQRALAIDPAIGTSYLDAEHVVFLMQENRSFDHVFGALKGVRGFNNLRAIRLANNYPVWLQSNKKNGSERVSWSTFPERLSNHGVDWKIYQNELSVGVGFEGEEDGWLGNFTDNTTEFFKQYHVRHIPNISPILKRTKKN